LFNSTVFPDVDTVIPSNEPSRVDFILLADDRACLQNITFLKPE